MGTRNLTIVRKDNQVKIAKYGQWDGYPSGLGIDLLAFLKTVTIERLNEIINYARIPSELEIDTINTFEDWVTRWPHMSRDCDGAKLLNILNQSNGDEEFLVPSSEEFAADSLFCEWCYVIDLDTNTLEVYTGFNRNPLKGKNEKFKYLNSVSKKICKNRSDRFYPVKFVKSYSLSDLPDDETFLSCLEPQEDDE